MKKLLIIPLTFLVGSFFVTSCGNTNKDAHKKAKVENSADTSTKKANKEGDEHVKKEKKEKKEKKNKKHEETSFFKLTRINDANTKMIYETQTALWM